MSINPTELMDKLELAADGPPEEFIYSFMDAFQLAKSTITQVRNGGERNVAPRDSGDIGIRKKLYFHALQDTDGDLFEYAEGLADQEIMGRYELRFVIVTDFKRLVAYDRKVDERLECDLAELPRHYAFFLPLAGYTKERTVEDTEADVRAAERMGKLCDLIHRQNEIKTPEQRHAVNVFLARLLFCLFAEDTGIFEKHQFTDALRHHTKDNDTARFFDDLFSVLSTEKRPRDLPAHFEDFPYVNGGLFRDEIKVPRLRGPGRRMILDSGALDWSEINPDIFGSMFQAVIDEDQRDSLGQHYTSPANIMKVLRPLFLDRLEADLAAGRGNPKKLKAFLKRLRGVKVFDPACGSGNFLILAYKELRHLEMEAISALDEADTRKTRNMMMSGISLSQFYGIEIDDFAHEIAMLSLWLAEHQMNQVFQERFGRADATLPLRSGGNIVLGNALRMDWEDVCPVENGDELYICGNPPFHGYRGRTDEQNADMARAFAGVPKYRKLDYVASWVWKAALFIQFNGSQAAFVTTSSINQGVQAGMLWPEVFRLGVGISFAYQSFPWVNSAKNRAGVHVSIVGLSTERPRMCALYSPLNSSFQRRKVRKISPYLIPGDEIAIKERSRPFGDTPRIATGNMPDDGGHLILSSSAVEHLLKESRISQRYIRPLVGTEEFLDGYRKWCLWIPKGDTGWREIPGIAKRVRAVKQKRLSGKRPHLADTPHRFAQVTQVEGRGFLLVPRHTSERREYIPVGYFNSDHIAKDSALIIPRATDYEFGLLMSVMHLSWLRLVAGRLESRTRYSTKLVYNTFPWPDASDRQRSEIESLARNIILIREDYYDWTMAERYDPDKMPAPLLDAHRKLDRAVERLYREAPFRSESERQEYLLAQYEKLVAEEAGE